MSKRYHLKIDIAGALRRSDAQIRGMFQDDNGEALSPKEARTLLKYELAMGRKFMSCGVCDNFDPEKGCLGHQE